MTESNHSLLGGLNTPTCYMCEYERVWKTTCVSNNTAGNNETIYESYSCWLFFCKYPDRKCRVKK